MSNFPLHTPETAPNEAKSSLESLQKQLGFIPNLHAKLATAPAALQAYLRLTQIYEKSSLTPTEQQIVSISASVENNCEFCVGAHSFIARNMVKVDDELLDAVRNETPIPDAQLNALAVFTREVVNQRGLVTDGQIQTFLNAGYTGQQVLEVIVGVTLKTLSNYTNHIVKTPLNSQFETERWTANTTAVSQSA